MLKPRFVVVAVFGGLFLLTLAGCKKQAPGASAPAAPTTLPTRPAAEARAALVTAIVVPSLDRSLRTVATLAQKVMPMMPPQQPAEMRTNILKAAKVPDAVAAQVKTDRPLAIVLLAPVGGGGPGKDPNPVAAVEMASPDAVKQAIAAAGAPAEKRMDAIAIKGPDGKPMWLWGRDNVLFVADAAETLERGVELVAEVRKTAASDDVVATLYPDAIAGAQGTTVKAALDGVREQMAAQRAAMAELAAANTHGKAPAPAAGDAGDLGQAVIDVFLARVADTASGDVVARLDAEKGLSLGVRLRARPGSAMAKAMAPAPYALDASVLAGDEAAVWSSGPSAWLADMIGAMRTRLGASQDKAAADMAAGLDRLAGALTGATSGALRFGKAGLAYEAAWALKPGTEPAAVIDTIHALGTSSLTPAMLAGLYGPLAPKLTWKKDGANLKLTVALPLKTLPKDAGAGVKKMLGGDKLEVLITAAADRLVVAMGSTAKARAAALAAGKAGSAPAGELATALAETKGHDGVAYLDFGAFMRVLMAAGGDKSEMPPGMAEAIKQSFPVVLSYRGGDALAFDVRMPVATLAGAGAAASGLMGAFLSGMAGGAGGPPPGMMPPRGVIQAVP